MMAFQTQGVHENWILLKKEERGVDYKGMYLLQLINYNCIMLQNSTHKITKNPFEVKTSQSGDWLEL